MVSSIVGAVTVARALPEGDEQAGAVLGAVRELVIWTIDEAAVSRRPAPGSLPATGCRVGSTDATGP
ncbi:hypothetical protein ACFV3F_26355 [Streptomyces sp. NPDC059717]|uniref:hypothetical protein n=1 Tax=Streptomyces sp. NPDC059717 TaxID=3346922 RepID=UPI0036AB2C2D